MIIKMKFRRVNPERVVLLDGRFEDMVHAGESYRCFIGELATIQDENSKPMLAMMICKCLGSIAGKFGNPLVLGSGTGILSNR